MLLLTTVDEGDIHVSTQPDTVKASLNLMSQIQHRQRQRALVTRGYEYASVGQSPFPQFNWNV